MTAGTEDLGKGTVLNVFRRNQNPGQIDQNTGRVWDGFSHHDDFTTPSPLLKMLMNKEGSMRVISTNANAQHCTGAGVGAGRWVNFNGRLTAKMLMLLRQS